MVGRTNAIGTGELRSVIAVTYPEGTICTCSNGTKILRARDTSGKALFNVTVGEWTVSCAYGSLISSKTVSITEEGQGISVDISECWLYNSGVDNEAITGGWYATNENSNLVFNTVNLSANRKTFTTNKKAINLSGFQTVELYVSDKDEAISTWTLGVFSSPGYNKSMNPVSQYSDPYMTGLCSIDVSSLSGDYYIGVGINRNVSASTGTHWMKISYIRLIK